ncbi:MAG: sn-glycerol-3-phosphate ABC transporter ATP-binding protein UgpC [Ilumatobacteraceae bacterium]
MTDVVLDKISKVYPGDIRAVDKLSLEIADGEFLVLVGPSGCGKSTALRMVAGLEDISEGELRIDGKRVNETLPRERDVAMVFQSYALYPHMNVYENIAFGLTLRKLPKQEIRDRVNKAGRMLGLKELLGRRPRDLSGGQRQRVAMGRAIVRDPRVFLMDEPLSNLDAKLRVQMRAEIANLQQRLQTTTIYVTHDQVEAMTMGHRVAVMRKGVLHQVAPPQELYDSPVNLFVAGFIGSPPMNLLEATLERDDNGYVVRIGTQPLRIDESVVAARPSLASHVGQKIAVGIRPEDLEDASLRPDHPADRRLRVGVQLTEALGSALIVHFTVDAPLIDTEDVREAQDLDDELLSLDNRTICIASLEPRSSVRRGDDIELTVDTVRLHLFDIGTGDAIT